MLIIEEFVTLWYNVNLYNSFVYRFVAILIPDVEPSSLYVLQ